MSAKRLIAIVGAMVGLSACSNFSATNMFSHYSAQTYPLHNELAQGQYAQAMQLVDASDNEQSELVLDNLEKGRVALLNDDAPTSIKALSESDKNIKVLQDRATISLSQSAQSIGGLLLNDNVTEFFPADYELGFLHLYLALGYLRTNQLDDALVEFRRANLVQEKAKKLRQSLLERESDELGQQGISANIASVLANYPEASSALSAVQNGYLFFLSGLMFETDGDLNNAYIDYKRALAINPESPMLAQSAIRCAKKLAMKDDVEQLTVRYGESAELQAGQSRVIIIQEQSLVDFLQGWKQSLMVFDANGQGSLLSFSLPFYAEPQPAHFLPLQLNDQSLTGNLLTDVNLMARNQLQEQITTIVLRQILRMVVKEQLRKEVAQGEPLSGVLVNVWNTMTDQPDTRSWMTLPAQVYGASEIVTTGTQRLSIGEKHYQFDTQDRGTTMVWLSRQATNSVVWHKQLGKL